MSKELTPEAQAAIAGSAATITWQDSSWMVAVGPYQEGAPKLYWKHHLEHAEPAGTA